MVEILFSMNRIGSPVPPWTFIGDTLAFPVVLVTSRFHSGPVRSINVNVHISFTYSDDSVLIETSFVFEIEFVVRV